jgi:thiamine kinase-like enzyme
LASEHTELITDCLTRMGTARTFTGYEVLTAGVSGSHTYRVQFAADPIILKVTLANSEPYILQRAQREFEFYRTLSNHVPVRVPNLLSSHADSGFGVCILLRAYQPAAPATTWREADYDKMARQLAMLHAQFWRKANVLAPYAWLRRPSSATDKGEIEQALDAWRDLRDQQRLRRILTDEVFESICHKLAHILSVDRIIHSFPVTLCHGDCHVGNLLCDAQENLIWADWQEVGVGAGPEDLSFFFQRALAMGNDIPVERITAVYQEHLQAETGAEISLSAVKRVVNASELRTSLLHWPFYLQQASAEQIANLLNPIELLAEDRY